MTNPTRTTMGADSLWDCAQCGASYYAFDLARDCCTADSYVCGICHTPHLSPANAKRCADICAAKEGAKYPVNAYQAVGDHYTMLRDILDAAFHQASEGKGKERHANDDAWQDQPIGQIGRMVGPGFNSGQAIKKLTEAMGMLSRGQRDAARREVLGAIVYAASVVMLIGEGE